MSKLPVQLSTILTVRNALFLSLCAASMIGGCVVAPPPRVVYAAPPPPPPAYVEPAPAAEAEMQASEPPPPLPEYQQPPCPEDGYMWTPGYWAWAGGGYYWVPGTWVAPPRVGVLWTPGYWGFVGGVYLFHPGYWGPHVGFYGGVNYGFGYAGVGFVGGRWAGNSFAYNTAVVNVNNTVVHNTYVNNVTVNNVTVNRVSYNGGAGGVAAAPTPQERRVMQEPHVPPTPAQHQHIQEAVRNPALSAKANGGHPAIAATPRPAAFNAPGVVGAKGAPRPPVASIQNAHAPSTPYGRPPTTGNTPIAGNAHPAAPYPPAAGTAARPPAAGAAAHPQAAGAPPASKPQPAKPAHPKPPSEKHEEGSRP